MINTTSKRPLHRQPSEERLSRAARMVGHYVRVHVQPFRSANAEINHVVEGKLISAAYLGGSVYDVIVVRTNGTAAYPIDRAISLAQVARIQVTLEAGR